ncbi:MAG TPA: hypothetical protein VFT22_41895, partial [Kofleriaceae bacterium]|nr:hypothetical protein [Kofleriaceae bacterium]
MYTVPYLILSWLRRAAVDARRRDRTARYLMWSVLAGVANAAMLVLAGGFVALLWSISPWLALAMIGVLVVPLVSGTLVRLVFVPAGYHRLAYYSALYSWSGTDPVAFALCAAAWACGDGDAIAWVEGRRDARKPLGDGEIVATALVTAARGDAPAARALLRSIAMIVEVHPAVRELAGEWLACDAAERGAWQELVADAETARWPATPLTYLLEGIAAHHTGRPSAPRAVELWARWALAPRRATTRALVRAALAGGTGAPSTRAPGGSGEPAAPGDAAAPADRPAAEATPLPGAVAAHLAFEARPATAESLAVA